MAAPLRRSARQRVTLAVALPGAANVVRTKLRGVAGPPRRGQEAAFARATRIRATELMIRPLRAESADAPAVLGVAANAGIHHDGHRRAPGGFVVCAVPGVHLRPPLGDSAQQRLLRARFFAVATVAMAAVAVATVALAGVYFAAVNFTGVDRLVRRRRRARPRADADHHCQQDSLVHRSLLSIECSRSRRAGGPSARQDIPRCAPLAAAAVTTTPL